MKTINILSVIITVTSIFTATASNGNVTRINPKMISIPVEQCESTEIDLSDLKKGEKSIDEQIAEDLQITEAKLPTFYTVKTPVKTVEIPTKFLN